MRDSNKDKWLPGFEPRQTPIIPEKDAKPEPREIITDFEKEIAFLFDGQTQHIYFGNRDRWDEPYDRSDKDKINAIHNLTNDENGPAIITLKNGRIFFTPKVDGMQILKRIKECVIYNPKNFPPETPIPEKYQVTVEKIIAFLQGDVEIFDNQEF